MNNSKLFMYVFLLINISLYGIKLKKKKNLKVISIIVVNFNFCQNYKANNE